MGYLGYKPADKPLTSADITDGIIVNADIANSTINLTTKVTGTLPLTNGGTGLSTLGTAAQELRVNSGATALEYYTPTVASSDFVLLATTDITSSTASLSFDGLFSSTYRNYKIIFNNVVPASSSQLRIRYMVSSSDVTAAYYMAGVINYRDSSGSSADSSLGAQWNNSFATISAGDDNNTNSAYGINGEITIYNPLSTTTYKVFSSNAFFFNSGLNYVFSNFTMGQNTNSTSALSGIKLSMTTGNIASGNFKLYGLK